MNPMPRILKRPVSYSDKKTGADGMDFCRFDSMFADDNGPVISDCNLAATYDVATTEHQQERRTRLQQKFRERIVVEPPHLTTRDWTEAFFIAALHSPHRIQSTLRNTHPIFPQEDTNLIETADDMFASDLNMSDDSDFVFGHEQVSPKENVAFVPADTSLEILDNAGNASFELADNAAERSNKKDQSLLSSLAATVEEALLSSSALKSAFVTPTTVRASKRKSARYHDNQLHPSVIAQIAAISINNNSNNSTVGSCIQVEEGEDEEKKKEEKNELHRLSSDWKEEMLSMASTNNCENQEDAEDKSKAIGNDGVSDDYGSDRACFEQSDGSDGQPEVEDVEQQHEEEQHGAKRKLHWKDRLSQTLVQAVAKSDIKSLRHEEREMDSEENGYNKDDGNDDDEYCLLPEGWEEYLSEEYPGIPYYFNRITGERVWERPMTSATIPTTMKTGSGRVRWKDQMYKKSSLCSSREPSPSYHISHDGIISGYLLKQSPGSHKTKTSWVILDGNKIRWGKNRTLAKKCTAYHKVVNARIPNEAEAAGQPLNGFFIKTVDKNSILYPRLKERFFAAGDARARAEWLRYLVVESCK